MYDHIDSKIDLYRRLLERHRDELLALLGADEATVELVRSGLTGLALWWQDHPEVARKQIVATAVSVLWTA